MSNEFVLPAGRPWDDTIARAIRFVHRLDQGKPWVIKVEPWKRERSDVQNRALWGVAYKTLSDETGNEPEDLHTYFCGEFFGWHEVEIMGQLRKKPRRSTTRDEHGKRDVVSTDVLAQFYDFIQRRAAETVGVYVPDPDPHWFEKREATA